MIKKYILIAIVISVIVGCSSDYELEDSIFIPDTEYSGLPQYSEWGYNSFGAYYDRKVFVSNNSEVPVKVIVNDTATTFYFNGVLESEDYYYDVEDMSVNFIIPDFDPKNYSDLIQLNDSIIDFTESGSDVDIKINDSLVDVKLINGTMHFKAARKLYVDELDVRVILSGVFEFQIIVDGEPMSVSYGRFDLSIGYSNFFILKN